MNTPTPAQALGEVDYRVSTSKPPPEFMTFEYVNSILRLDPDTGELYWRKRLNSRRGADERAGSPSKSGGKYGKHRWLIRIHGRKYHRYRLVFLLFHGRWPTLTIDHINHDQLDDRPSNLREATVVQNLYHKPIRPRRLPLPAGVEQHRSGRFGGRIKKEGRFICLGTYDTAEEAHQAYMAARKTHFGEFA